MLWCPFFKYNNCTTKFVFVGNNQVWHSISKLKYIYTYNILCDSMNDFECQLEDGQTKE